MGSSLWAGSMEDPGHEVAHQPHELTAGAAPRNPGQSSSPLVAGSCSKAWVPRDSRGTLRSLLPAAQ